MTKSSAVPPAVPGNLEETQVKGRPEFLRQVIDINPNFIFVKDREGRFVLVNKAVAEAYGTTVENLIGKTDADFNSNAEEVENFRHDDLEVMNTLQEKLVPEEVITDAKGNVRYLQTFKRPLVDPDGTARHVLGVSVDITQLKAAEEERRELQAQMLHGQKLESLGVLAGGIAHDFNNLLVGVMGYADLAQMEIPADAKAQESIKQIQVAASQAADLCKQLLDYSGKGRFVTEPVNLNAVVEQITDLLKVSVSKNATLHFDLKEDLPPINADVTQVRQVIMNLITNASDAMESKGRISITTGTVECTSDCVQGMSVAENLSPGVYAFLEVADEGVGMDEKTMEKIFDPFFSTKFSGRGLGLAAVLGIVRGHNGGVKVTSSEGEGTTLKVFFPALDEEAPKGEDAERRSSWPSGGMILVVDDEEMVRETTRRMLEHAGFMVFTAKDGEQALEIFREKADDILAVLLDLTMPGMKGEETFREIQKIRKNTPIILMSGYDEPDVARRFEAEGSAGFLTKPFHATDVLEHIRRLQETSTPRVSPPPGD